MKDTKWYKMYGARAERAKIGTLVFRIGSIQKVGVILSLPVPDEDKSYYYSTVDVHWVTGSTAGKVTSENLYDIGDLQEIIEDKNKEMNTLFGYLAKAQEGAAKCLSTKTSPA